MQEHLSKYESRPEYEEAVKEIREGIYVDNIHLGGETTDQTSSYKKKAVTIFKEGELCFHKWHSYAKELENSGNNDEFESTFAKESCGTKPRETKLLGVPWDKKDDTIAVSFPTSIRETEKLTEPTKREVLQTLASIFGPLGIAAPVLLT